MMQMMWKRIVILFLLTIFNGCSENPGGGGIGGTGKIPTITTEGLVIGSVEGFGSIVINNRRFETDDTEIWIDGSSAQLHDLQIGMNIRARVDFDAMEAIGIQYQPLVTGPIEDISSDTGILRVLGQTIVKINDTIFDGLSEKHLENGMVIEVSGHRNTDNNILASYVRLSPTPEQYYNVALVEETFPDESTVLLSGTRFSYRDLLEKRQVSSPLFEYLYLKPGSLLRSEVDPASYEANSSTTGMVPVIHALTEIDSATYLPNESVEIEGLVTKIGEKIYVSGVQVEIDDDTLGFSRSGTQVIELDLIENERVDLTSTATTNNSVVARDIYFLDRP